MALASVPWRFWFFAIGLIVLFGAALSRRDTRVPVTDRVAVWSDIDVVAISKGPSIGRTVGPPQLTLAAVRSGADAVSASWVAYSFVARADFAVRRVNSFEAAILVENPSDWTINHHRLQVAGRLIRFRIEKRP